MDVEETGATFAENAMLKARAIMEASGLPAIADDSGLCVDALNGAPRRVLRPLRRARGWTTWAGYRLLLENMRGQTTRAAHFVSAICLLLSQRGRADGRGAAAPAPSPSPPWGTDGFGYDPVFFVPDMERPSPS